MIRACDKAVWPYNFTIKAMLSIKYDLLLKCKLYMIL